MDPVLRAAYNKAFSEDHYRAYLGRLQGRLGFTIPFRVAETPLFLPRGVRTRLETHAREIVEQICAPELIAKARKAIPKELDVPGEDDLASCIQVDFAIVQNPDGSFDGRLVELQGFPSLYGLIVIQTEEMAEELRTMGMERPWTTYFGGMSRQDYLEKLRRTILGGCDPGEVILLDLAPEQQKTFVDFVSTKILLGIDPVCPTELEREGRRLFRRVQGQRVAVRRIYNRIVFDELAQRKTQMPFAYTDELDVSWCPHPNWYWTWSKYTIPHLSHPSIPRARFLSDIDAKDLPGDLSRFVLKPLFSFAGSGVKVDVTRADVDAVPEDQRASWILQEKIDYAAAFHTPSGQAVKAEVRMMFLREPGKPRPELAMNLVRLSRGKMLGVDHNKDLDWVGGTVGIWPGDDLRGRRMAYDCQSCGACCVNPDENRAEGFVWYVEVPAGEKLLKRGDLLKRYCRTDQQGIVHLRLEPSHRCVALRGKLGERVHCAIYDVRPRGCRLVEAGSARCEQLRRERGIG